MTSEKHDKVWNVLSSYNFIPKEDGIQCTICRKIMIDPYIGSCGCRYCSRCIKEYIQNEMKYCPGGKCVCKEEYLEMGVNLVKDLHTRQIICKMSIKCPNESCLVWEKLENMEDHIRLCGVRFQECPYKSIGCVNEEETESKLKEHLLSEILVHSELIVDAINNLRNDFNSLSQRIERRYQKIKKGSETGKRGEIDSEEEREDEYGKEKSKIVKSKIKSKNKKTNEEENTSVANDIKTDKEGMSSRIKDLDLSQRYDFTYIITEFSKKTKTTSLYYSDPFFKGHFKFCLGFKFFSAAFSISGEYLQLFVYIMKDDREESALRPMKQTVRVCVINQLSSEVHKSWMRNYEIGSDTSLFDEAKVDLNGGIYCGDISITNLKQTPGVISEDSLLVCCTFSEE